MTPDEAALRAALVRILSRVALLGSLGVFSLTAVVVVGPWEITGAAIALIGGFQQIPAAALGGLLTLAAVTHGLRPTDLREEKP